MKVKCKINRLMEIDSSNFKKWLDRFIHLDEDIDLGLEIGREYVVCGIIFYENYPFYYLFEGSGDSYPTPFPAGFFDIMDFRMSTYWVLSYKFEDGENSAALLFKDWANEPRFYENVLDDGEDAIKKMAEIKSILEAEFEN